MRIKNQDTFPVTIKKFYTDVDGVIIDKSTLPPNLQVELPFYLFGKMDKDGSYKIANESTPVKESTWEYFKFVIASTYDFQLFTGLNTIKGQILTGDYVFIYTDSFDTPTYFCYIIITSGQRSYASINDSLYLEGITIDTIVYQSSNVAQYTESMSLIILNRTGLYKDNQFNPIDFRDPYIRQDDIIRMKLQMLLSRYIGINSYILFDTDTINFQIVFSLGE